MKQAFLVTAFLCLFSGGFLAPSEKIAYLLILAGCICMIGYTLSKGD